MAVKNGVHLGEDGGLTESLQARSSIDLVGGPFAVVESDPGVFTTLIRKLGIIGVEVEEVYEIEPRTLDRLNPKGLVMCFTWKQDHHQPKEFLDPAAKDVWFANQLNDDACASLAILNVLFNCPDVDLGKELLDFKAETSGMSPKMKGLAISNLRLLRDAHNSLARYRNFIPYSTQYLNLTTYSPADVRGALNAIAEMTEETCTSKRKSSKKRIKAVGPDSIAKSKTTTQLRRKKQQVENLPDSYHFIGYVPAYGKVWELDGLKAGPLEVGELPSASCSDGWEDIVRPALRLKMEKYGGNSNGNIEFNLLAFVQDRYEAKSDELELLKRQRAAIERRLNADYQGDWRLKVDATLTENVGDIFSTSIQPMENGSAFSKDFGSRKMEGDMAILNTSLEQLPAAWELCAASATQAKLAVEEEVTKALQMQTDTLKRTYDYEPFIREYITELHKQGILENLL